MSTSSFRSSRVLFVTFTALALSTTADCGRAADGKRVPIGANVDLEINGDKRRVLIEAKVCLREGLLEQLLCRKNTKEHEAILTAAVDGKDIHKALLLAGAEPGGTFRETRPKPKLAAGTPIAITLEYENDQKERVVVSARDWIRDQKTKKPLDTDWVFAGSQLIPDPMDKDKPPYYAANDGDLIVVCNFEGALLDLPIYSSKNNDALAFEPNTDKIPKLETKVTIVLTPVKK